jgi:hypothetical protein
MTTDLKDQIHLLMERGIHPVSADDIAGRQSAGTTLFPLNKARPALRPGRVAAICVGVAAVACAGALVAAQPGGPGSPARAGAGRRAPAVLTAAVVGRLVTASRVALAHSGRAVIDSRESLDGVLQQASTEDITFSGTDWNDALREDGQPATIQSAINRVVNGQAYNYFIAADGLAWYHDTGPNAVARLSIPDPRLLLRELAPGARFVEAGRIVLAGVAVRELKATSLRGLPRLNMPDIWPAGKVTSLEVWVDARGVVRQLSVAGAQTVRVWGYPDNPRKQRLLRQFLAMVRQLARKRHISTSGAIQLAKSSALGEQLKKHQVFLVRQATDATTITVRFVDIGQPQVIRVPANAIPAYGLG